MLQSVLYPQVLYSLFFFITLNLIYFSGQFLASFFIFTEKISKHLLFFKLIIGIVPFVIIPALLYTKGNSIIIGLLIPIFFLLKNNAPIRFKWIKIPKNEILKINIIVIPILIFQYLLFSKVGNWTLLPIDINNYSEIIYHMKHGFESKYGALNSLFPTNVPQRTPYHYPELWLTASFQTIFSNLKIGYTLLFITYPLLVSVYLIGIISLFNKFKWHIHIILGLCFLFIGIIDLSFIRELFQDGHLLSSNTVIFENNGFFFNILPFSYHGQKHLTFYIVSLLFFILLKKSSYKHALLILAFTPLINIGLMPGIFGGIIIMLTINYIKNKKVLISLKNLLPFILVILFVLIYYKLNGGYDIERQTSLNTLSSDLNLKGELFKIALKLSYTVIWIVIIYGVYSLLLIKNRTIVHENLEILYFTIACLIAGITTRPLIEGFNSAQFLTYLLPLLNVSIIILFIETIESKSNWIVFGLVTFILLIASINWSKTYFNCTTRREINIDKLHGEIFTKKANSLLLNYNEPKIAYLLNDLDVKNIQPGFWYVYYPCEFLLTHDYFNLYSLNYPYYRYPKNSLSSRYTNWNHQIYLLKNKKINSKQFEIHIANFIKNYKINIIIAKKHSFINQSIQRLIKDSIIDNKTGDRLYLVK